MADRVGKLCSFVVRGSTKDVRASLTFRVSASPLISWSWLLTIEFLFDPCFRSLEAAASGRAQGVGLPHLASPTLYSFPFTPAAVTSKASADFMEINAPCFG